MNYAHDWLIIRWEPPKLPGDFLPRVENISNPANLFCFLHRFLADVEGGQSDVEAL